MVFPESAIRTMEDFSSAIRKAIRTPLLWLAILYVCVGLAYALVTPLFEKPDEDGHYGYILYLRESHKLPPLIFSEGFPSEYKQPPLYYFVTATLTGWLPSTADPDQMLTTNPYMDFSVPGYRNDNRNVFLHPPYLTPLVLGARLISLLFGFGTMLSSYYLALKLFQKHSLVPIATAAVVGFQPQFLYIATAVNNDAAMAFFATLVLTVLVYRLRRDDVPHFAILMGAILGLASITKVSGLVLFPLTGLALLIIHRGLSRTLVRDGVLILTVALLIGGWWYVRNGLLYGDPLSIGVHTSGDTPVRLFGSRIRHDLLSIEHTFWANLSRTFVGQIGLEKALVWWGRVSLGLLAVGLVLNWLNLPPRAMDSGSQRSPWGFRTWIILLSWPLTFLLLLITYWTQEGSWAYGRLLFPAVAPIALCLVLGWVYVFPLDWRRLSLTCGVGAVVIISSLLPALSIYPMYHPWRKPDSEDLGQPVGTIYSDSDAGARVARLIGYSLLEPYVSPGAYLPIELCWDPLGRTKVPYAVLVQLLDLSQLDAYGSPGVWGGRRTYPGLGNLPTDRWTLGEPFCDRILVHVSPVAPTPLGAAIEIGFIEPATGKRLQATGPEGSPADMSVLRGVPVLNTEDLPASELEFAYVIDGAIGLNRVIVSTSKSDDMMVTLVWQSIEPVTYDATVFVHLLEANGDLLAQVDRQPLAGQFPTSYWLPGQVVTDTIRLSPANDHYDGPMTLHVGMYTWPSLERLAVLDSSGVLQPNNVITIDTPSLLPGEEVIVP